MHKIDLYLINCGNDLDKGGEVAKIGGVNIVNFT